MVVVCLALQSEELAHWKIIDNSLLVPPRVEYVTPHKTAPGVAAVNACYLPFIYPPPNPSLPPLFSRFALTSQGNEVYGGAETSAGIFLHRSSDDAIVKGEEHALVPSFRCKRREKICTAFFFGVTCGCILCKLGRPKYIGREALNVQYFWIRYLPPCIRAVSGSIVMFSSDIDLTR